MERLTKRLSSGAPAYNYPASCYFDDNSGPDRIAQSAFRQRCVERLAEYEDTRLTPEAFQSYVVFFQDLIGNQKASEALDRFRQLVKADRDGRLVAPPCKAGDTVYEVTSRKTISEYRVKAIRVELFCTFIEWDIVAGFVDKSIFGVPVNEIGKTVFLTHEEAKCALEAMKDE